MSSSLLLASYSSELGQKACDVASNAIGCGTGLLEPGGFVANSINIFIAIIGALSVLMIIVGGLRYVLSGGDAAGLKSAKDTIIYALVGLAISLLSFVIVSFVISRLA